MTPGKVASWTRYLPQQLAEHGYRSYHAGKWHIKARPLKGTGFRHSYDIADQLRFFTPTRHVRDDELLPPVTGGESYYATTHITDEAIGQLKSHAGSNAPFFQYLAYTSPHFPLHAWQKDIDEYKDRFGEGWDAVRRNRHARMRKMGLIHCALAKMEPEMRPSWNTTDAELAAKIGPGEVMHARPWETLSAEQKALQRLKMAIHAAMITRMDKEIGRVIGQLKAMGEYENTVILFLSDNGASSEQIIRGDGHDAGARPGSGASHLCLGPGWAAAANAPFRLYKSWVHEGGVASPMIVHWPAGVKTKGALRGDVCHFVDVAPTLLELAGTKGEWRGPGKSLVPAFGKDGAAKQRDVYFNHSNNRALRQGDWKVVAAGKEGAWELYDLKRDRCEQVNLAGQDPGRLKAMAAEWERLDAQWAADREAEGPSPSGE
jgi:arylsulfatase